MKLLFRPDKFKDKNGVEIELEDIEIKDLYHDGWYNIEIVRNEKFPNSVKSFSVNTIWDLQKEIEEIWNICLPDEIFKRKNNLGRLNEDSGVKLHLDEQGLKNMNKGLKIALGMIDTESLSPPERPQIFIDTNDGHKKMKMSDGSTFCIACGNYH